MARKQRRLALKAPSEKPGSEIPRARASGIRPRAAPVDPGLLPPRRADERPTLIPPAKRVGREDDLDPMPPSTPLNEILYRKAMGDLSGAAAVGASLLESERVPVIIVPRMARKQLVFQAAELAILSRINDSQTVRLVIFESGLAPSDAVIAICSLLDRGVIALR